MAYKGRRDPEVAMLVPRGACSIYNSKGRGQMIEVSVPGELVSSYDPRTTKWGTIMVEPKQVRSIDDETNVVFVNDGAAISCTVKDDKHNEIPNTEEILTPAHIIGRWLKWYRYNRFVPFGSAGSLATFVMQNLDCDSILLYDDYKTSHMRIEEYANRLPFIL